MPRSTDARAKAVRTAGLLFQEQGYAATGLTEIIERSGSPKGSFYFHFPGGKEQLAVEALTAAGESVAEALRGLAARAPGPARLVRDYVKLQERMLENSGYRQGCPVATVTLEMASESEPIRAAAAGVFALWSGILADYLVRHGHRPGDAARSAEHIVATLEGALLLARAQQSTKPLRNAARTLTATLG
ncbi:TetR/AcrR family transcriptional regulator [Amycolatopsis sp.]|uniref:TetR/AcrR family transcriptional regulator n=1 Tax=Amycolatopsis sp. TaxID=37632 RepID=UPI002C53EA64|nr:TetR/AcrR family transcriptional regulator [Amycolatopsis sp.]HVV08273.1 TetR/AcrR family transcriptional regulator [Amycolatopsis sp.]